MHICERCGNIIKQQFTDYKSLHVFGKIFYFCSNMHRQIWLDDHSRSFHKEEN